VTFEAVLARPHQERLPVAAVALALLLHAATGATLWWVAPINRVDVEPEPIMVSFDTLQQAEKAGLPIDSPTASAPAQPASAASALQQAMAAPSPETLQEPQPQPKPEAAPLLPIFEFSIPPLTEAPPPPTSRDFRAPARPGTIPPKVVQRRPALLPPPNVPQRPLPERSASLPSAAPTATPGEPSAGRGPRNDYLSRVFRHLEPHRFELANRGHPHGRVRTRVTLARDGRVLDVVVADSSGSPALDALEVAAIRRGSPFPPLPDAMAGDTVVVWLPMNY
jgi:protein TonB